MAFDNVPVPVENVIGEVGGGFKVGGKAGRPRAPSAAAGHTVLSSPDCHEHPELGQVQHGHQHLRDDKETDR